MQRVGMQVAERAVLHVQRRGRCRIVSAGMRMAGVVVSAAEIFPATVVGDAVMTGMRRQGRLGKGMGNCRRPRCDDDRKNGQPGCYGAMHFLVNLLMV
jgi:hypothetical protein